jgi:hypothetical protein
MHRVLAMVSVCRRGKPGCRWSTPPGGNLNRDRECIFSGRAFVKIRRFFLCRVKFFHEPQAISRFAFNRVFEIFRPNRKCSYPHHLLWVPKSLPFSPSSSVHIVFPNHKRLHGPWQCEAMLRRPLEEPSHDATPGAFEAR